MYQTYTQIWKKAKLLFAFILMLQISFAQFANFTINNASQCLTGNSFVFTNTSSAGATAYQWSFGDGTTSTAINPTKTFAYSGNYSVQLIATIGGIDYYVNKTVEVNPIPQCGFTFIAATSAGDSYTFLSYSSISSGIMNYNWDFGDGGTSTISNPTHTYAANGSYFATLTITSDKGCVCSVSKTVLVTVSSGGYSPNLIFAINNNSQCLAGNNFIFTNTTAVVSGATYRWTFGDGATSNLANPSHSYASVGSYSVSLIATISGIDYTYSQIVNVTAAPTITIAGTACTGSTLTATTNTSNISSIVWKNGISVVQTNTPTWNTSYSIVAGNNGAGTNANQLNVAKGIYVDKAGNVYVIDNYQSRVQKWAVGATTGITVATGLQITGVGVDDAGNVYTVDDINNWVQKWTPGSLTPTTVAGGNGNGTAANQLNNPRGNLHIDGSGNIYINDVGNNRIQKWAVAAISGTTVAGGNGSGSAANQFNSAYSFFVDASGNIYVADLGNYRIQLWTVGATSGVTVAGGNGNGSAANQFDAGADLVYVDAAGNIYSVDRFQGRIQYWAAGASTGVTAFGGSYGSAPHDQPFIFVNTNNGDIYVLDQPNNRVLKYAVTNTISNTYTTTTAGTYTATITSFGGCTATSNSIVVNQTPTVYPIVGAYNVCANTTTIFVDTANIGGTWSSSNTSIATINSSGVVTGVAAGTATIAYTVNNAGCTATVTKNITVFANPTISLTGGGACASSITANLSGGSASYLIWRLNGTPLDTVYNTSNTTHSVVGTGTYTLDIVTSDGCSATASTIVSSIGIAPTIAINAGTSCGNVTVCAGSSITFNSSITNGGGSPLIEWKVNGSNVATGASFTTSSLNNNDIVTATLTSNISCASPNPATSNSITIAVKATPTVTITGTACVGSMLSLGGSSLSGSTITWLVGGVPMAAAAPSIDTNAVTVAGGLSSGSGASQLNNQQGIFVDNNNHLYIADFGNDRVQKWTIGASTGNTIAGGNGQGLASNQTNGYGLFVDKNDNLYTVESLHRVQKWAPGATNGVTIAGTGFAGNSATQFTLPKSVYIDDCGNMYVADTYNHRVQKFSNGSTVGVTVAGTGVSGNSAAQLSYPTHVQVDVQGNIYVADNGNSRIQRFASGSLTATTVAGTGVAGNTNNKLDNAWGMFVDGGGNIYVADTYNNRIMYWANGATTGVKIAGTGKYGSGANGLNYPAHVFVDASGNVYVSDSHNNRVQKFSAIAPVSIMPTVAGTYTAIVSNAYGCSVTSNTVTVTTCTPSTNPSPSFTVNTTAQCITGNNFVFTNTSTAPSGTTYSWNFGDNTSSTLINPTHTYTTAGSYYVQMIAHYNGQDYYASGQSVVVGAKPVAGFNTIAGTGSGNAYTFISTSTINNGSMSYAWSFGDGGTSTLVSPQHIYAATGTYNVKLVITSDLGCKDSITQTITVTTSGTGGSTPTPSFTTNTTNQCITGNSFVFTNTSTAPSGTTYSWNFGDNTSSSLANPTHTYTLSGYYNVQMIAHYNGQDYYASSQSVYVGAKPVASFNTIAGTGSGNAHTFISTSTIANGSMTYAWDFGDGGTSTQNSPQHIFSGAGTMNVKLVVTSDLGCKDSITQAVVICPLLTNQAFSINAASSCFVGNYFGVQNYFGNSAGYPMTYLWNYGDGTTSTLQNPPTHNYAAVGTYTITLTTTLSYPGCAVKTGTYSLPVTVHPMPVAGFNISGSPTTMCYAANNYTFNNTTSIANGSMSFAWDFGDTTSSSLYSPSHSYTHAGRTDLDSDNGKIFIKLVATSDNNCKDSVTNFVRLYNIPIASNIVISSVTGSPDHPLSRTSSPFYVFHSRMANDTIQCFGGFNWFSNTITGNYTSPYDFWQVNFDDGTNGTGTFMGHGNPYNIYTTTGVHPVSGNIVSSNGCLSNTVYGSVTLTPNADTLPHSVIGIHSEVITNVGTDPFGTSYNHYKLFFAHLGSTACRPIIAAYWRISYLSGNSYWNHGYYDAGPYTGLLPLTTDSFNFQFDADTTNTFQIRLITMNDLGMIDTAYATFGATNSGYTNYRAANPALFNNIIKTYPNPAINEIKVAVKLNKNTTTNLIVYNALGQRVLTTKQYIFGNVVEEVKLNIQQLQVGTYYLQIKDDKNDILANTKFVKLK